jgi:hypothetical protein
LLGGVGKGTKGTHKQHGERGASMGETLALKEGPCGEVWGILPGVNLFNRM